jgi:hypothetical protein
VPLENVWNGLDLEKSHWVLGHFSGVKAQAKIEEVIPEGCGQVSLLWMTSLLERSKKSLAN